MVEVAQEFPSAQVIGLDISTVERDYVPSNARFIIGDVNDGIPLMDNSTDLVHSR